MMKRGRETYGSKTSWQVESRDICYDFDRRAVIDGVLCQILHFLTYVAHIVRYVSELLVHCRYLEMVVQRQRIADLRSVIY